MRTTASMPHTRFPGVKSAGIRGDFIEGELDFSKPYDPFEVYLTKPEESPHLQLANLGEGIGEIRLFTLHWGPLSYKPYARDPWIRNHIFWLNHQTWQDVEPVKCDPYFQIDAGSFELERIPVRNIVHLWGAFHSGDCGKLTAALREYADTIQFPDSEDPGDAHSTQSLAIIAAAVKGGEQSLKEGAAHLLQHEIRSLGFSARHPEPCFEYSGTSEPIGFRIAYHVPDLISAIYYMMAWDIGSAGALLDCPNCGKAFAPKNATQKYCNPGCTSASNSRRTYERRSRNKPAK